MSAHTVKDFTEYEIAFNFGFFFPIRICLQLQFRVLIHVIPGFSFITDSFLVQPYFMWTYSFSFENFPTSANEGTKINRKYCQFPLDALILPLAVYNSVSNATSFLPLYWRIVTKQITDYRLLIELWKLCLKSLSECEHSKPIMYGRKLCQFYKL